MRCVWFFLMAVSLSVSVDSASVAAGVAAECRGVGSLAFGRSRRGGLWVLTGVPVSCRLAVCRVLFGAGFEVCRAGSAVASGRVWLAFRGSEALESVAVPGFAALFPVAPGSRAHRLLSGG